MSIYHKLYLSLSLLISGNITSQETMFSHTNINHLIESQEDKKSSVEEEIDQDLYELFNLFFDDHDKTPFSKIVTQVIHLLKRKMSRLDNEQMLKCDEVIKILEKNKANHSFPVWAKILINPDLLNLMSEQTRLYIHNVSNQKKITTLIRKLQSC